MVTCLSEALVGVEAEGGARIFCPSPLCAV